MKEKHTHHHHHHHHPEVTDSMSRVFIFCIILNLLFVGIEAVIGMRYNSVGLLSDAGHNLSDIFSLMLVLIAFRASKLHSNQRFTYGYKKVTVLTSLTNALILLVAAGVIIIESIEKLKNPQPISGAAISWTAGAGIIVNGLTTWLLMRGSKHDINIKGAYLHMLMDTMVSVGVVISGITITYTGWTQIDPIIGIALAILITISTYNLLKESIIMTLDGIPSSVDIKHIAKELDNAPSVKEWHHMHLWAISTTEYAATIHIVVENFEMMNTAKEEVREIFNKANVRHHTIETEIKGEQCKLNSCGQDNFHKSRQDCKQDL